jgi:hypothetical protein
VRHAFLIGPPRHLLHTQPRGAPCLLDRAALIWLRCAPRISRWARGWGGGGAEPDAIYIIYV